MRTIEVRQEVKLFAEQMEKRLQSHDDRPGWKNEQVDYLYALLLSKVDKLGDTSSSNKEKKLKLTADIANFAMMIHENMSREEHEHES
ncbi:hypothetical protein HCC36_06880 [Listeria booriae]|uniref:Uncharacterized protein n=1 Tax=Listeria booriae TaxID=1552123 RepID=A0A842FVY5_9LIST|nr:hypothetical protein [Listeria booriae]MBC2292955.1 hypothetical protein [Listeria booriae]